MALGTVKASGGLQTQLVTDRSSEILSQAASGLGDAVSRLAQTGLGYLNSRTDIERIYDQRAQQSKGLELDTQFLQYQQDRAKEFTEYSRGRSASPAGMTKDYDAALAVKEEEFLKTVPPRFQEAMKAKLAQDRALRVGSAFTSELSLLDTADTNNLNKGLTTIGSGLKGGTATLEDAEATWTAMVMGSGLPEVDKQTFIDNGKATLQGLEFGTIVEQSAAGYGAVSDGTGGDVAAAGLLPQDRGVLNAIAENEAPAYNVWNGGTTFEGYEDHPAASGTKPGESTAAGRYQFILGTWRAASSSYERTYGVKVPNFSPEWQDRVALYWAEHQFNAHHSGATFREILASGDPQQLLIIRDVLGKPRSDNPNDLEWQGLGHMGDAEFIEIMTGQKGFAGGGTGPAEAPNVWTDPRFSSLSLDSKMSFANAAAAAAEQTKRDTATQISLQRESFLDQAYNAGYSNQPGVLEALQKSGNWDAEAQAKYNSGQEVFRASEKGVSTVGASLQAGTPLSQSEIKSFGKWFGEDNFAGIAAGDQPAYDKLRWAVGQARIFPEGSADSFAAAMGNPDTAPAALAFLASAYAGDSSILTRSGFSKEVIGDVNLYKRLAERSGSPEKAFENYTKAKNAESLTGKSETQLTTEASKLFAETYPTGSDIVNEHFDGWLSMSPNTTLNPNTEGQLQLDAASAFQDGYLIYGTSEGAEAYMEASLAATWGMTQTRTYRKGNVEFADSVLMKYPPENFYKATEGDYGFLYKAISDYAAAGGASPSDAVLLPDEQTDREVREGKLPTYRVIGVGEGGEAIVLPGRFGGENLDAEQRTSIAKDSLRNNALTGINAFGEKVAELSSKLVSAQAMGASPEELSIIQGELSKAEAGVAGARLSATENGYLAADVPTSLSDPNFESFAATAVDTFTNDSGMPRRIKALANTYQGLSFPEANMKAMTELFMKDYGVSAEVAAALVSKVME